MKSIAAVIAVAVLGVTGVCHADDVKPAPPFAVPLKEWPVTAPPLSLETALGLSFRTEGGVVRPSAWSLVKTSVVVRPRPSWAWPRSVSWAQLPGFSMPLWTWQGGWQSASPTIRLASLALPVSPKPPWWLQGVWAATAADAVPPWRRVRTPNFRLPMGRSRFAGEKILEPPGRYARWTDRLETVLSDIRDVNRRCLVMTQKPLPLGQVYRGCAHWVAGRCLITRVDDPGVARHEAAHCAGWPADHPL